MKRWIMMLIALVVCVSFSEAQTTDKEERAKLREEVVSLEELERAPGSSASPPSGFLI